MIQSTPIQTLGGCEVAVAELTGIPTSAPAVAAIDKPRQGAVPVLHLINGEHYSGAERVQDLLGLHLPEEAFAAGFACVKPGKFAASRLSVACPLLLAPMRHKFDWQVADRIAEIVQRDEYALIHAHTPRTALLGSLAARRAGVPLVYHVHSPSSCDSTRLLQNWINSQIEHFSLRRAAHVITVSESLRQHMIARGHQPADVTCVPNGVPCLAGVTPRAVPGAGWSIGMIALFRPRKGLEVLLEALAMLRSRQIPVRLRAIGPFESQDYESAIMCLVERLGIADLVDWVGFTRDVPRQLEKIDLLALPSLFGEGLPMVVLEAMAAGVPLVASDVEGTPEAVRHRETGLLVQPRSVSELATAIKEFVSGRIDYHEASHRSIVRHRVHFSVEAMAHGVAEVYRRVLCR